MMPVLRSTDIALVILKLPEHFYIENVCEIFKEIVWGVKKQNLPAPEFDLCSSVLSLVHLYVYSCTQVLVVEVYTRVPVHTHSVQ